MKSRLLFLTAVAILAISAGANAEDNDRERGRRGPPPEAIEACASGTAGETCSFAGRRGETVSGTCEARRDEELVCFPEGGPPHRGRPSVERDDSMG